MCLFLPYGSLRSRKFAAMATRHSGFSFRYFDFNFQNSKYVMWPKHVVNISVFIPTDFKHVNVQATCTSSYGQNSKKYSTPFEWRGEGVALDFLVLQRYPI